MDIGEFCEYCRSRAGRVTEDTPFGDNVLVYKIENKMFALASLTDLPPTVNLKCDPAHAMELRERYEAVREGYHMNKKHWNTIVLDGSVPPREVRTMVDESYDLVVSGLSKKIRERIRKGK